MREIRTWTGTWQSQQVLLTSENRWRNSIFFHFTKERIVQCRMMRCTKLEKALNDHWVMTRKQWREENSPLRRNNVRACGKNDRLQKCRRKRLRIVESGIYPRRLYFFYGLPGWFVSRHVSTDSNNSLSTLLFIFIFSYNMFENSCLCREKFQFIRQFVGIILG